METPSNRATRPMHRLAAWSVLLFCLTFLCGCDNTLKLDGLALSYDGNGHTGGTVPAAVPLAPGGSVTVAGGQEMQRTGYTFATWNTSADGSGDTYTAGSTFVMGTSPVTLYAQWTVGGNGGPFTVTYHGNGHTGGTVPTDTAQYPDRATVTVANAGTMTRSNHVFDSWNTAADGSGTSYTAGSTFTITADVDLYADWLPVPMVTATAGDTQVALGWTPITGATEYRVYYHTADNRGAATLWNTVAGSVTTANATVTGLTNGTTYYFWIAGLIASTEQFVTTTSVTATPSSSLFTPMASTIVPGQNALEVAPDRTIVVPFNQPLLSASVSSSHITVTAGGSNVTVDLAVGTGGDTVEISPQSGAWTQGTLHTVTFGTGTSSTSGHSLAAPYVFTFTTLTDVDFLARWPFDNDGNDASGHSQTATLTGTSFDATQKHEGTHSLVVAATNVVDIGTFALGNQFTYSAWVKITDTNDSMTLFANGATGLTTDGIRCFVNDSGTNDARLVVQTGNGTSGLQIQTATGFVTFGAWRHVAITVDRTAGRAYVYFDGAQATTYDSVTTLQSNTIRTDFGNSAQAYLNKLPGGGADYVGNLDDVRVYNRILDAAEIANLAAEN